MTKLEGWTRLSHISRKTSEIWGTLWPVVRTDPWSVFRTARISVEDIYTTAVDHRCPLEIPILETGRLRLRGHTLADFADTSAMWRDDSVMVYMGGKPLTREESWTRLLRYAGHWALLGFGYWVIEEKATGHFVGEIGLADFKRDLQPSLGGIPELGWVLTPSKHGQGYATEAAKAVLRWGQEHFGPSQFCCIIHPEHSASMNVAKKCGFVPEGLSQYKGRPTILLKLTLS